MERRGRFSPLLTVVLLTGVAACGSDTTPSPGPSLAPIDAALRVTIDGGDSSTAVMAQSDVRFEAVASAANVREVRIDFGDGESAVQSPARHVYTGAGTYTAKATFTTASGQQASGQQFTASQPVVVKAVEGLWYHAAFNPSSRRFEVRRLTLSQEGTELRGVLSSNGDIDRPVTGLLSAERHARLSTGGQTFEGTISSSVSGAGALWPLSVNGGTANGQTLRFNPAVGEPSGPPVANLVLRPQLGVIVEGLDVRYDASGSSGDGLSYFLEFGDGQNTTDSVSDHAPGREGTLDARLIVVDRFGRDAVATQRFNVYTLWVDGAEEGNYGSYHYWLHSFTNPSNGRFETRQLKFQRHEGRLIIGRYRHPVQIPGQFPPFSNFIGTLSGTRDIQFVLDGGGIDFTGTLTPSGGIALTLRGGSANGQLLEFRVAGY